MPEAVVFAHPHSRVTDESYLDAIGRGDRFAVEAVLDRYGARLYGLAALMCRPSQAEMIVVEVFTELWARPDRFTSSEEPLGTLLVHETHRRAVACQRRDDSARSAVAGAMLSVRVGEDSAFERDHLRRCLGNGVTDQVEALPDDVRDVVVLAYVAGLTSHELARTLGMSHVTVIHACRSGLGRLGPGGDLTLTAAEQ